MVDDRDDDGKFSERYLDKEFIHAVEDNEVASTQNVADKVGCSYDLAYRRLKQLEENDKITSKKVRDAFIWLPIEE